MILGISISFATLISFLLILAALAEMGSRRAGLLLIWFLISALLPLAMIRILGMIVSNPDKAWNTYKAFDRTGNALTNGDWDQMISTRARIARDAGKKWGCYLCYLLDKVQPHHCDKSVG